MSEAGLAVPDALNHVLRTPPAGMPRFVPAEALPTGEAYEAFIRRTGQVPTRDNLHDCFNGLVWKQFPLTKRRLNQLQSEEIERKGVGSRRGPVRDAITVFDENGALLLAPPVLWDALLARDWHRLLVVERHVWKQAQLVLFGHALMEQLTSPRKSITAHVLIEKFAINEFSATDLGTRITGPGTSSSLDAVLAARLSAEGLACKPFTPLPVLGVPGWCAANEDPAFYADTQVFRPPRQLNA